MGHEKERPPGECLGEDAILEYLEGAQAPVVRAACEMHLAGCGRCLERLASAMRLLRTDLSQEEQAAVDEALSQWNRRNVRPVPTSRSGSGARRAWGYVLVGIAALLVLTVLFLWQPRRPQLSSSDIVDQLLAANRPVEAQLSGQSYLPFETTRGPGTGQQYELLLALRERSASDHDLGRFYLVEKDYEMAVVFLEKAAADPKAPPAVHSDLGVAYLYRGSDGDVERAGGELELALSLNDEFAPAVFNLAFVRLRQKKPAEAARELRRYLELDSTSGWAEEAARRLSRLEPGNQ